MHEFAIASEIVKSVLSELEGKEAKRVLDVVLELGELTSINPEQLGFCFDVARKGTILCDAKLTIQTMPVLVRCSCGYEGNPGEGRENITPFTYLVCPRCGGGGLEIFKGTEMSIKNIRYES